LLDTTALMRRICSFCLFLSVARIASAATLPPNFQESTIYSGLVYPTVVKFAPDGRVFVAEKSGLIKVFANLTSPTPTIFADLRPQVQDYWDRGLLGMELDPAFPTRPYVYVLYAFDKNPADPTATIGTWGDGCPTPPGGTNSGCPVLGRVSRLDASAAWPVQATEQVLLEGFPQQFPSHSVGALVFGPDGALYVSGGEGASFTGVDYGQLGGGGGAGPGQSVPVNPFADPPGPRGVALTPPLAQGGALRSQSVRRPTGQPAVLSGVLLRIDPNTGAALPDNPLFASSDLNARRIVGYGFRNPFRFAIRPGSTELWIGDVGWTQTEEINRFDVSAGTAANFGWPCYEGTIPQPAYQALGLNTCQSLYAEGSVRLPFFSYEHPNPIVPGENCQVGSSSVSGIAFYTGGGYPAAYQNALFFTDWARRCIWVMPADANGIPDPSHVATFAANLSGGSVNIERGPGGDLFYVDYDGGRIQRIAYFGGNQPPLVDLRASTDSGPSPLLVQFDASASIDPEGGVLTFAWDLDDDGQFNDSAAAAPSWTFTTPGPHRVRVRVSDPQSNASIGSITIYADNLPPTATILTPSPSLTWRVGQPITFSGVANDPDQGPLPPSTFRWTLVINHCPSNCHQHTVQTWAGFAAGSFSAPDHEYPSYLTLTLTVTDAAGLTATASVDLQPQTVPITVDTVPSGLTIAFGAQAATTPFTRTVIVGSANTISAASPQNGGSGSLGFKMWSDGGQATHVLTAPAAPLTVVATYRPIAELTLTYAAPPRAVLTGRVATTATVANAGPTTATNVQFVQGVPDGVVPLTPLPAGCASATGTVTCTVAQIPVGGNTSFPLTYRAVKPGTFTLAAGVQANEADINGADNAASSALNVRPAGDFNDDGKDDLFWLNTSTGTGFWTFLNGAAITGASALTPDRGAGWRLGGIADFNGDGSADLFWRNQTTGANEIWLMNGVARTSTVAIAPVSDVNWYVAATADFNGDGWPDLVWRHRTSGLVMIVPMTGTTPGAAIFLPTVTDVTWELIGAPDLNGDGAPDLVWRRSTDGFMYVWMMNGTTPATVVQLGGVGANWRASSFADVNGDGKPDIIFREQTAGYDAVLYLIGVTANGGALLPTVTDLNWTIAAPR
jgi:glucose/arabinose dehydrogenase